MLFLFGHEHIGRFLNLHKWTFKIEKKLHYTILLSRWVFKPMQKKIHSKTPLRVNKFEMSRFFMSMFNFKEKYEGNYRSNNPQNNY